MKKIFAIILHYGDSKITTRCIESIFITKNKFEEIVVIDNTNKLKIESGKLKVRNLKIINNKKNLGYAGGMNVGIKYALSKNADHVMLLNNDIIFENDIASKLVEFLNGKKDAGIVAPAIKFMRNGKTIYDLGGRVNKLYGKTNHNEVGKDEMLKQVQHDNIREVDYVSGCSMLVKKDVFKNAGLLDENYFLYYEDVDFCLRAKANGFLTYVLPSVLIYHELSKSVGKNSSIAIYYQTRSALLFAKKQLGLKIFFNNFFVLYQSLYLFVKQPKTGIKSFKAFFDFYK